MLVDAGLLTGVDEIDRQHKKIFEKTNELLKAQSNGSPRAVVQAYLDFLVDYIGRHFSTEEAIMDGINYPGLPAHREEHKKFSEGLRDLARQYTDHPGSETLSKKAILGAVKWVKDHIMGHDHEMAVFIRETFRRA